MFYVKTNLPDGMAITTEITDENVYCRCPDCGKEVGVDLAEVLAGCDGDLYGTAVCCTGCTRKRLREVRHE
jgi:hypothetical protein